MSFLGGRTFSLLALLFYAFSNTAIFGVSLIKIPSLWSDDAPENDYNDVYFWLAIAATLPVLYANIMSSYREKAAVEVIENASVNRLSDLNKIAVATIKAAGPVASIYHVLNQTPIYCRVLISFFSMLGSQYMFYFLFKRSEHILPDRVERKKWVAFYLTLGFSLSEFMIQYSTLLFSGNEFQDDAIHPSRDTLNAVLFSVLSLCEVFLFRQNMISFMKRINGMPTFSFKKESLVSHYCSFLLSFLIGNIFLILPRQLSDNKLTHMESALIGATPAAICVPGFYACMYSFFSNKQLRNDTQEQQIAVENDCNPLLGQ